MLAVALCGLKRGLRATKDATGGGVLFALLGTHKGCPYGYSFPLSTLTTPSNRNPQGVTMPRDLRPVAAGVVEVARATFIFHLYSVLCTLFSALCTLFNVLSLFFPLNVINC